MRIVNSKQFSTDNFYGDQLEILQGTASPSGDAVPYSNAPVGTIMTRRVTANHVQFLVKAKDDNRDDDWVIYRGVISERVTYADFTDGGAAVGTYSSTEDIPVGACVENVNVTNVTAFSGDTSAAMTIGDGTDADRYHNSTFNVFATASAVATGAATGAPSGVRHHAATKSPVLTITAGSDWGAVATTGALTYTLFYNL